MIGLIPPTEPKRTQGVVVDQFREQFGAFTFIFEYGDPNYRYGDQTTFTRRFPWAEVDKLLTNADVQSRRPNDRNIIIRKAPHYAAARTTPDYDKWDKQKVFRLFEAACLWNDEEPSLPMSEAAKATFNRFHAAVYNKTIITRLDLDEAYDLARHQWGDYPEEGEDPINVNTKVGRKALKGFAIWYGEKPPFLYADQRAR